MAPQTNPNDEYVNPTSSTAAAPIPPEIFPEELAKQQASEQAGTSSEGGSGGTKPSGRK